MATRRGPASSESGHVLHVTCRHVELFVILAVISIYIVGYKMLCIVLRKLLTIEKCQKKNIPFPLILIKVNLEETK